jgi:hypothetical protein
VSVPRKKGGREIATYVMIAPIKRGQKDPDVPYAIVKTAKGALRRVVYWRVRLFIDEKKRRELNQRQEDDV